MKTKKIVWSGMLLALSLVIPQAFHLTGVPQSGAVFLPMHIPVLFAGFLLGPLYGGLLGILAPMISSIVIGMPGPVILPFMGGELAAYGVVSGLLFHQYKLYQKTWGIYGSLIGAMIAGRMIYALMLMGATYLLHIPMGGIDAVITATITGIPGIVIQLIFLPATLLTFKKVGILDGFVRPDEVTMP